MSDTEEESDETEDEETDDNMNYVKKERNKIKQKCLHKFKRKHNANLALEEDVMLCAFKYLPKSDLLRCMLVCKFWAGNHY